MKKNEFDEFYQYITRFELIEDEGEVVEDTKGMYWNALCNVSFVLVMKKAREVYRSLLVPCNLNQLSPKVFTGENQNPGLYGKIEKEERFYM